MVTTRPPKTIVKPTALGPVANTDTKLLIYGLFQKGRVLAQDGVNRQQQDVIDYLLQEENRVLRAGLRGKRLKLSDDDRRRLAVKAQALGREALAQIASVATPATASALVPLPHRSQVRWQQEPEPRPTSDGEGYP